MALAGAAQAGQRRLLYGVNVVLTAVLAVALLSIGIWAAGRFGGRVDLTSSGENSLSSRTTKLVSGLDQDITITGLYTTALKEIRKYAEKHKTAVADLLDLYETAGRGKVSVNMIDPSADKAGVTALLKRLAEKPAYAEEAKPHAAALESFPQLNADLNERMQQELTELTPLAADDKLRNVPEIALIQRSMQNMLQDAQTTLDDVTQLQNDDIPRYGKAVELVRDHLTKTKDQLSRFKTWFSQQIAKLSQLSPAAGQYARTASTRYQLMIDPIDAALGRMENLKTVKLEDLYDQLNRGQTIVIESPDEAMVVSEDDVWTFRRDANAPAPPDGDPRDFSGEAAISSTILKLTQKDKTAVVFVRFGGQALLKPDFSQMNPMTRQMPQAPFGVINGMMGDQNFETAEWDVQKQPAPPEVEGATRKIFVVFPPTAPAQPNPMQPARTPPISEEQKASVIAAVNESGMAIFLTSFDLPRGPMPFPTPYAYADYLKNEWGIDVRSSHIAMQFQVNPRGNGDAWIPASRQATLLTSGANGAFRFTDQAISKPEQSLPGGMIAVAPLLMVEGDGKPADVTLEPIAETNNSENIWAFSDINRFQEDMQNVENAGTRLYEGDIAAPFPIALAGTRKDGKKLVVFGSQQIVSDGLLNQASLMQVGNRVVLASSFPANADLFLNALHWLTGNADRIAVGPRKSDVPRLDKLKEGAMAGFCNVFLVGIWPGVALLAGVGVFLMRRR